MNSPFLSDVNFSFANMTTDYYVCQRSSASPNAGEFNVHLDILPVPKGMNGIFALRKRMFGCSLPPVSIIWAPER